MFTGIIEATGRVVATRPANGDLRLRIASGALPLVGAALGDSIATNGVCLTVVELPGDGYWADVSRETLDFTTVAQWRIGDTVNLERALTPSSRLGGHLVSGHIDGTGEVIERREDARSIRLTVRAPVELARYIAHKGSICVDGVSLTVNAVNGADFELNIVPHTAQVTIIGGYRPGTRVNLEVDVIARYLERLLQGGSVTGANLSGGHGVDDDAAPPAAGAITAAFLAEHGFGSGSGPDSQQ